MSGQLQPLVALRWRMVRRPAARWGFLALAALVPALCVGAVVAGSYAPRHLERDVLLLAPTAFLAVALVAVLAPLVAGGGNDLFPPEQLTAYPVSSRTTYLASLLLTPLNLAWTTQLVMLLGLTAYLAERQAGLALALLTCVAYVWLVTVGGQAIAWLVVGVRHRRWGRWLTWGLAAAIAVAVALLVVTQRVTDLVDNAPTTWVVIAVVNGAGGAVQEWFAVTALVALAGWVAYAGGRWACAWAVRQPGDAARRIDATPVRRRPQRVSALRQQLAVDRASIWRSASLRRGLLVLGVLPGFVAAVAGLAWPSLVLLPGLVAAGAGLLFGVNAFCLDGSGAVWLASLPRRPAVAFWTKALVTSEVCAVAVVLTVLAGSTRTGRAPTGSEVVALAACAVVSVLRVVATCMRLSVTQPHRADLRGPRDTPAPPGVMAAYSARLAFSTSLLAVLFSGLAQVPDWRLTLLVAIPFALLSARHLAGTARRWEDPASRARVVATVASG